MKMTKVKLGDILEAKRGTSLSGEYYDTKGKYIRLTLGNFNYPGGGFKENNIKKDIYFTGPIKKEFILHKGDIITPLTEQVAGLLGETARIPESDKFIQSADVALLIPNEKYLDKDYMYYLISSSGIKKQLSAAAQQTKIRHTSPDKIKLCETWIPPLEFQKKAAGLLKAIDDMIANNMAIILETTSITKTLYDYWFMQFDFPDENGKPYKSSGGKMIWSDEIKRELPATWQVRRLHDIAEYVTEKISNEKLDENTYVGNDNMLNEMGGKKYSEYVPDKGVSTKYKAGDVLVGNIRPYFHKIWRASCTGGCSPDVLCLRALEGIPSEFLFAVLARKSFFDYDTAGTKGSKMPRGDKTHIMNYPVVFNKDIAEKFANTVGSILPMVEVLQSENQELSSLRDFLIPLLMNGQVTFKEKEA